jgi:hypothetical protein
MPIVLFQLFMYEALGLCGEGKGGQLIDEAEWIPNKAGKSLSCGWVDSMIIALTAQPSYS